MHVEAMTVNQNSGLLERESLQLPQLGADEVLVEVSHCGVCRGDLRLFNKKNKSCREIPGHEVVGNIIQVGSSLLQSRVGSRIGIGWQSASCNACVWCERGTPELCPTQEETCIGRPGGYATHIKVQSQFAVSIPEELNSIDAAPLLCGGLAVFTPLLQENLPANSRVGVVGIGGLGHLAIQFTKAMNYVTVAFSSSSKKKNDALEFGASDFIDMTDLLAFDQTASTCDFIICTSSGELDWKRLIKALKPGGKLCLVGVSASELRLSVSDLIDERKTITGNPIGSPHTLSKLFDFVIEHKIQPRTISLLMTDANQAIHKLQNRDIFYRAVLIQNLHS